MDTTHFDRITMVLAERPGRRDLLRLLGLGALASGSFSLLGSEDAEGRKRRKKRKKNKSKKKKCKGKCGGKCPRCGVGTTCDDRNDCTTALCDTTTGVCKVPDDNPECGLDTDGVNGCFRRENAERNGEVYCSRQTCRLDGVNSCADCKGQEICSPQGGNGFECCLPCGSPL